MTISTAAAEKIVAFVDDTKNSGLRVKVVGGGCSGLQYKMELSNERKGDKVFENGQARLFIDRKSYLYLTGTEVDYVNTLQATGFQMKNPNVKRSCGCGESFIV